ncbi:uncharacterized protein LOC117374666 [Periophthalmus magnuspinnatus]|uniref:uncharacterized protein LOC117374666 n=1 Tax=Periophthalmus magnuspinnatus TaxID=409849 RepID=UPI00145A035D|nr:uncharacterized protein LOC117374666 [Periophthalmus magnuspinnatus]
MNGLIHGEDRQWQCPVRNAAAAATSRQHASDTVWESAAVRSGSLWLTQAQAPLEFGPGHGAHGADGCSRSAHRSWRRFTEPNIQMRAQTLKPGTSTQLQKGNAVILRAEMNTTPAPTFPSTLLTSEQLTVVAASFSSLVFFVVIVVMLSIIYRKDPQCCKLRSYQAQRSDMASPPQYYSSRQTLVGSPCEQTHIPEDSTQSGQLFYVGLPSSYNLEAPMPRLPSYESVRKKDRQRHIHMMIADRFGLNGTMVGEPPPTYEESIRDSVEIPYNQSSSCLDVTDSHMSYTNSGYNHHSDSPPPPVCNTDRGTPPV